MSSKQWLILILGSLILIGGVILGTRYPYHEAESTVTVPRYLRQVTFPDGTRCVIAQQESYLPVAVSCNWDKTHE